MPSSLVSVGLPVYNGQRYLSIAIESVLAQTHSNIELVICDNCSTDRSEAICRDFSSRDSRVRYHRNERNIGAAGNFCRTFELAKGEYFRWLSADDSIGPGSVEKCLTLLMSDPGLALACTKTVFVDELGKETGPYDAVQALPQARAIDRVRGAIDQDPWCNAVYGLVRRDTLSRTALLGPFPGSDKTLLTELAMHGRFAEVPEPLFFRRIHPGAYSFAVSAERDRTFYKPEEEKRGGIPMARESRHRVENLKAAIRSPASSRQKLAMLGYIARMTWWQRKEIAAELGAGLRSTYSRH